MEEQNIQVPDELKLDYEIYLRIKNKEVKRFFASTLTLYIATIDMWKKFFMSVVSIVVIITFPIWGLVFRIWRDIFLAHGKQE